MQRNRLDRIETQGLRVVLKTRHNWSYSAAIDNMALQLRQLQLDEQVVGVAQDRPKAYVSLTAVG
jgi:hypothetical protein